MASFLSPSSQQEQQQALHAGPTPDQVRTAAKAIALTLRDQTYAVVGGAACTLLGSTRDTIDIDIVVLQGATKATQQKLKDQPSFFTVDPRTLHTYYRSTPPVEIEILTPPSMFREKFDEETKLVVVDGVKVLKPSLILNAKCFSILGRATDGRKRSDAADIMFLLGWCMRHGLETSGGEVPRANEEFVKWFVERYGGKELWRSSGYNIGKDV